MHSMIKLDGAHSKQHVPLLDFRTVQCNTIYMKIFIDAILQKQKITDTDPAS